MRPFSGRCVVGSGAGDNFGRHLSPGPAACLGLLGLAVEHSPPQILVLGF